MAVSHAGFRASSCCACNRSNRTLPPAHRTPDVGSSSPCGRYARRAAGPARIRRWRAAHRRASRLAPTPPAEPGPAGAEFSCRAGGFDCAPDCGQGLVEALQCMESRLVVEDLAIREVDEPQPCSQNATRTKQRDGVELHLEQRLGLRHCAHGRRRPAGLVVDHPHFAGRCDIDPIDKAAQHHSIGQFDLDSLLAALRIESGRVFEAVVAAQQRLGFGQDLGLLLGGQLIGQTGVRGRRRSPRGIHE